MSYVGNVDPASLAKYPSGRGLISGGSGREARGGCDRRSVAIARASASSTSAGSGDIARASGHSSRGHGSGKVDTAGLVGKGASGGVVCGTDVLLQTCCQ